MDSIGALIVALIGAGVGAYFAILKSRKERLWLDRYETLRDIIISLGTIESTFSSSHMEQRGVSVMGRIESQKLQEEWPVAMHMLRQNLAKLRLLFKDDLIAELRTSVVELHSAFTDIYQNDSSHSPELHEAVAQRASYAAEKAILVAQENCL